MSLIIKRCKKTTRKKSVATNPRGAFERSNNADSFSPLLPSFRSGYRPLSMYRRQLHQFLLDEVPRDKISMGTKIVAIEQDHERVVIQCSDGQSHQGSILVGADGAYSGVRQSLHTLLQSEGKLSASDATPLKVHHRSILGTTGPLDKAKFPRVHDKIAHTGIFIGENSTHTVRQTTRQETLIFLSRALSTLPLTHTLLSFSLLVALFFGR